MEPIINLEDPVVKTFGKRRPNPDAVAAGMALQNAGAALFRSQGHGLVPKGVYRFKTHEEADEWWMNMIAKPSSGGA